MGLSKGCVQIDVETVLQPMVLKQQCDLSYLQQLNDMREINLLFIIDYRGYDEETLANFNQYLLDLYKLLPGNRNVEILLEDNLIDNQLCLCHQKTTTFLTYNNNFNIVKNGACTLYYDHEQIKDKFYDLYGCKTCPYQLKCHDMCPSILERIGISSLPYFLSKALAA